MKTCLKLGISILLLSVSFSGLTQVLTRYAKHEIIGGNGNFGVSDSGPLITLSPPDPATIPESSTYASGNNILQFGNAIGTDYTLENSGEWFQTPHGRVWKLNLKISGVNSLNFIFNELTLPENGVLYLYNEERTMLYGPIINRNRGLNPQFITDPIKGETITLELYEPQDAFGSSRLSIAKVIMGHRDLFDDSVQSFNQKNINDLANRSGIIPNGDISTSQATIILADGASMGSGVLLNNTCEDFTPYILMALPSRSKVENLVFRFPYRRSTNGSGSMTEAWISYHGSTFRAGIESEQIALVEMSNRPNASTGVHYAGWKLEKSNLGTSQHALTTLLDPRGSEVATSHTIPITTISGPGLLCNEAQYELIHLTDDTQVTGWTVSSPEAVAVSVRNNTYTLSRLNSFSGSIIFKVHLATNCGNITIERRIWVGEPVIKNAFVPLNWVLPDQQVPLTVATVRGSRSTGVHKIEIQQMNGEYKTTLQGSGLEFGLPATGIYKVDVFARNDCGFSTQPYSMVLVCKDTSTNELFSINQQTNSGKVMVSLKGDEKLDYSFDRSLMPSYHAVIYNRNSESILASNSHDGKISFDTSKLAKGTYKLTVYYGDRRTEDHPIRIGN